MQLSNFTSNFLKFFFGENGDNQYPPEDADPTGLVSWEQGYPTKYSDDPLQNGLYILRQKMNGIFGTLSKEIKYQQLFQSRFFDNKIVSLGGYPRGASCFVWQDQSTLRLIENPQNNIFVVPVRVISMKDNNTTNPYASGAVNTDWWIDDGRAIGGIYISDVNLNTPPDGYLDIGSTTAQQIFNKNDYPRIKSLLDSNGGNWGYFKNYSGDPTNKFELINRRGYFHRVWSNGSSIDSARQFQTLQNDAIREIEGDFPAYTARYQSNLYAHLIFPWASNWPSTKADTNGIKNEGPFELYTTTQNELVSPARYFRGISGDVQDLTSGAINIRFKASKIIPIANENRPYNFNLKYYVKI